MQGVVFVETLRRTWRQTLFWGLGLGALAALVVLMLPLFDAIDFAGILESMPPIMLQAIGIGDDMEFAVSPEGLIALGFFGKMALIFMVYPVVMGMRVTSNEEDDGTLDILLSQPIPRWRVMLEKFAAYLLTIFVLSLLILGGLWLGAGAVNIPLDPGRMAEASFNLLPTLTLVMVFTIFLGALFSRRQWVLALTTIFVVASFMLDSVGGLAKGSAAETLRLISFFNYYNPSGVMQYGLTWGNTVGMLAVSAALLAAALWLFQRRDVGT
ncbi:MAG: ABC transporter permease subunit [Chloroflexi bacterium]|nr:ABC transporter permease subunit [Chloroflexota bacterium]